MGYYNFGVGEEMDRESLLVYDGSGEFVLSVVAPSVFANSFPVHGPLSSASYQVALELSGPLHLQHPLSQLALYPFPVFAILWRNLRLCRSSSVFYILYLHHHAFHRLGGMAEGHAYAVSRLDKGIQSPLSQCTRNTPMVHPARTIRAIFS